MDRIQKGSLTKFHGSKFFQGSVLIPWFEVKHTFWIRANQSFVLSSNCKHWKWIWKSKLSFWKILSAKILNSIQISFFLNTYTTNISTFGNIRIDIDSLYFLVEDTAPLSYKWTSLAYSTWRCFNSNASEAKQYNSPQSWSVLICISYLKNYIQMQLFIHTLLSLKRFSRFHNFRNEIAISENVSRKYSLCENITMPTVRRRKHCPTQQTLVNIYSHKSKYAYMLNHLILMHCHCLRYRSLTVQTGRQQAI